MRTTEKGDEEHEYRSWSLGKRDCEALRVHTGMGLLWPLPLGAASQARSTRCYPGDLDSATCSASAVVASVVGAAAVAAEVEGLDAALWEEGRRSTPASYALAAEVPCIHRAHTSRWEEA